MEMLRGWGSMYIMLFPSLHQVPNVKGMGEYVYYAIPFTTPGAKC